MGGLVPFEWAAKKVLGPTLDEVGEDFRRLYITGREKLIRIAQRKIPDIEDGNVANLRVAADVLANGAMAADNEVCAEYFGGLLAASRTKDGKDDSLTPLVDVVKSLSSEQLRIHYWAYHTLNKALLALRPRPKVAEAPRRIFFQYLGPPDSASGHLGDLSVLRQRGLIESARTGLPVIRSKSDGREWAVPYVEVEATSFGMMLYAAAFNNLMWWQAIGTIRTEHHEDFPGIPLPKGYGFDLPSLLESVHEDGPFDLIRH
ncbi:MAG: hypothetical protein F4Z32_05400 [Gemmatimonadetes bacterium]|nr:hypothetical protein [Gemmatimonadota bacterium]